MGRSQMQNQVAVCFQTGTIATNATSASLIDCAGEQMGTVYVFMAAATAVNSSAKWTSIVFQHGTTTDVSNFTAIDGLTGTTEATATTNQFVLDEHNDNTNAHSIQADLDLSSLERYLRVVKQAPASHASTSNMIVFKRSPNSPSNAAGRGVSSGSPTVVVRMGSAAGTKMS